MSSQLRLVDPKLFEAKVHFLVETDLLFKLVLHQLFEASQRFALLKLVRATARQLNYLQILRFHLIVSFIRLATCCGGDFQSRLWVLDYLL
jgi:hypothetical protein